MDDREAHDIEVVRSRLIQRYPDLESDVLENLIVAVLGRFDGCRVRDFVPLLVERAATRTLDATYSRAPAPPVPIATDVPTTAPIEPVVPAASIGGVRRVFARRSPRLL
ncbi:three-helix bundle dimerization domain-containing protein [Rhodococcus wratislaviensis]|uniref:three-helix bundle dimerization domain-containing protein n=1 Tax=Rhodococcus wratislaviensis TaxID=44752 RepID=UPI00366483C3